MFSSNTSAANGAANYIEDVFSTYLYTGNGATGQAINNGINLSTKGGLVWLKSRTTPSGSSSNNLYDTARGASQLLISNTTDAQTTATRLSFQTTGFNLTNEASSTNESGVNYASWTFRKQPKFFDVVTWTGNDATSRTLSHSINGTVGCVMVKKTSSAGNWIVWHRTFPTAGDYIILNSTAAKQNDVDNGISTTNTTFTVGFGLNVSGENYVAYLFAHDAGGFGLTGTDNVISCGSFTKSSGVVASITLGYEPQWLLFKRTDTAENWFMIDNMRGMTMSTDAYLIPNLSNAESNLDFVTPTATGFEATNNFNNGTYIYIAIRRGPMKVPTSGTSVFKPMYGTGGTPSFTTTFPVDFIMDGRPAYGWEGYTGSRLQGGNLMYTTTTAAETSAFSSNVVYDYSYGWGGSAFNSTHFSYMLGRAPSFFDEVCYTGTGSARTVTHNLGVAPELMIVKNRSIVSDWRAYSASLGATQNLKPNTTDAATSSTLIWNDTAPTSSVFTVGIAAGVNGSGNNMVAYLFATCAGVSKVGSYTGTGTTLQVNCGFTGGARFVLIKRTDSTGDWYVWDSARGIVAGNDPYLLMNSSAAEVTNTDYVDTYSAGFEISSTAPAAINASGGTFIFLAIA